MTRVNQNLEEAHLVNDGGEFNCLGEGYGSFDENISELARLSLTGSIEGKIRGNGGIGGSGYGSIERMPKIYLEDPNGNRIPVLLWAFSRDTGPAFIEVYAKDKDADFIIRRFAESPLILIH